MAEDIWQNLPYPVAERSVFERGWPTVPAEWRAESNCGYGCEDHTGIKDLLLVLRPMVNRRLDKLRLEAAKPSPADAATSALGGGEARATPEIFAADHPNSEAPRAIGSSLEADVQLVIDAIDSTAPLRRTIERLGNSAHPDVDNLADWLLVSALRINGPPPEGVLAEATEDGVTVRIARAPGHKCERCWHYSDDIGAHPSHPTLCGRCVAVLA